jgi:uncharacterized phage protein gp47/JayE
LDIVSIAVASTAGVIEFAGDHNLALGMTITVAGTTNYDGTYEVNGVQPSYVTFFFDEVQVPEQTGTVTSLSATVNVSAQTTGSETNISNGGQIAIDTPIAGLDDTAIVQVYGLRGGTEEETDDNYRSRILLSRSIISGVFTPDQIRLTVFSIAGNTRAWVKKPTIITPGTGTFDDPEAGQCSVFYLRDNDSPITPNIDQIADTKDVIIESGAMPANMVEEDLFVQAPTLVSSAFVFTSISPDTPTMRTAVEAQLQAFFDDTIDFEETVTLESYLGAIQNTQDLDTGAWITTFELFSVGGVDPPADIDIDAGEIATLGIVTFT